MSRRRWTYTLGGVPLPEPLEVSEDFQTRAEAQPVYTDRYMEGTTSPIDGSDIGSRAKRREHMRLHNLADAADYKGVWEKARKERAELRAGTRGTDFTGALREALERSGK